MEGSHSRSMLNFFILLPTLIPSSMRHPYRSSIGLLPEDMVMEVLARVAAHSHVDIFNVESVCRSFRRVVDDDRILRRISIEQIMLSWRREKLAFLGRCIQFGNPMALYVQGVKNYFDKGLETQGIEFLRRASDEGCLEAAYVLGIVFLSRHEELKSKGMELINKVRSSSCLKQCRTRIEYLRKHFWLNNRDGWNTGVKICTDSGHDLKIRGGWDSLEYELEDDSKCNACICDCEVQFFLKRILHVI